MTLFSDVDWLILVVVAVFLLLGKESGSTLRMLGRWYARAGKLKQELLQEFSRAAEIPTLPGNRLTIRGTLLGLDPAPTHVSGIPAAVTVAPAIRSSPTVAPAVGPWTGGMPTPTWTMTVPVDPAREGWTR
jgi:hypothetical protein